MGYHKSDTKSFMLMSSSASLCITCVGPNSLGGNFEGMGGRVLENMQLINPQHAWNRCGGEFAGLQKGLPGPAPQLEVFHLAKHYTMHVPMLLFL